MRSAVLLGVMCMLEEWGRLPTDHVLHLHLLFEAILSVCRVHIFHHETGILDKNYSSIIVLALGSPIDTNTCAGNEDRRIVCISCK